jgi:hypothetical protein
MRPRFQRRSALAATLADPAGHAAELCNSDASDQSVAAAKEMDLTVILPYLTAPASVSHSLIRNQ